MKTHFLAACGTALLAGLAASPAAADLPGPFMAGYVCNVEGTPSEMAMQVTVLPGDSAVTYEPGVNPDITSVGSWGWQLDIQGVLSYGDYVFRFSGDSYGGMFWLVAPEGVFHRVDAHFHQLPNGFRVIADPILARPSHYAVFDCIPADEIAQQLPIGLVN